jgi:bifunctional DNA-binding transcriptional regulator/antitoxin component of YhaV-PrlF toxin-antitoxin module
MENIRVAPELVRVRSRGQLTIPREMREALSLDENTGPQHFPGWQGIDYSPKRLQRASLAKEVEREFREGNK